MVIGFLRLSDVSHVVNPGRTSQKIWGFLVQNVQARGMTLN